MLLKYLPLSEFDTASQVPFRHTEFLPQRLFCPRSSMHWVSISLRFWIFFFSCRALCSIHLLCEVFLALSRQSWCLSRPESSTYLYFRVIYKNCNCFLICLSFPFSYDLLEDRNSVLLIFLFPVPIAVSEGTQRTWWGQSQVEKERKESKREK